MKEIPTSTSSSTPDLTRGLGLREAAALVVGTIIGTGIFLKAAVMAQLVGGISTIILAWLVAAFLSLMGALCFAELGSRLPKSGGEYVFLQAGWPKSVSFLYGWTRFWIASPSAISAYAVGAATFATGFMNVDLLGGKSVLAVSLILFFTIINCLKISFGGSVQVALTLLKVGLIIILAAGVFLLSPSGTWLNFSNDAEASWQGLVSPSFGAAVLAALWAFDGWNNMPMAAAEIKDAQKNVPRALFIGLAIVTAMYLLANLAWFYGVPFTELVTSNSTKYPDALPVATKAVLPFMGTAAISFVSVAFVLSALGAMNGSILTSARVPWAMAHDGLFPKWMQKLSPNTHVPARVIVIQGFISSALAATGSFDQLTDYVVFSSWLWYGLAAASLFKLRKIGGDFTGYKIKLFPLIPIVFIVSTVWLMLQAIYSNPKACGVGALIILAGIPVYRARRHTQISKPSEQL